MKGMNIADTEVSSDIVAKTCNCKEKDRKVTYFSRFLPQFVSR